MSAHRGSMRACLHGFRVYRGVQFMAIVQFMMQSFAMRPLPVCSMPHQPLHLVNAVLRPLRATRFPCRRADARLGPAGPESKAVQAAQAGFFKPVKPTTGPGAFADTTWSVYLKASEGGGVMFTVELLDNQACRFSDKDDLGHWDCLDRKVMFDKPNGIFKDTLVFSAVLQPPSVEDNRAKLVNGSVERYVRANTTANQGAVEDGYVPFGTFGGYMLVEGAE
mmetsp:Transcript_35619/g.74812  ORF Transcript_35619/g.74812 Transcript_35619/m.74812 type:complete len:222 (-) Transcript_35619:190-855(-)